MSSLHQEQEIDQWARTLPYWEQAALDLVLRRITLAPSHYDTLLQLLLEENDLAPAIAQRPRLSFGSAGKPAEPGSPAVRLISLSDLRNVNALAEGQTLRFGPGLTAIYGGNASGKSGYARVLVLCHSLSLG